MLIPIVKGRKREEDQCFAQGPMASWGSWEPLCQVGLLLIWALGMGLGVLRGGDKRRKFSCFIPVIICPTYCGF